MRINSNNMRRKIMNLYREDSRVASDDLLLISKVWASEGWSKDRTLYENLKHVSSPETVRRTRAKMTSEGVIKATAQATALRRENFKQVLRSI